MRSKLSRILFLTFSTLFTLCGTYSFSEHKIGVVNFSNCVTESLVGRQEQEALDNVKNQMTSLVKDLEDQLQDLSEKFNDSDYMDGLSPEGEQEMKVKFQTLREEYERYQNQFYQVMQQANMKLIQVVSAYVNQATEKLSKEKSLSLVVNKDACFSFDESFDITENVVQEMNKRFEENQKLGNTQPQPSQE